MEWYELEVRTLEARLRARDLPVDPAVFYGSSSIRLWDHLAQDLGDPRAVNLGFGGATLQACVHFFHRLLPPLQPASLVVYAGDNDLGDGLAARVVAESFGELLRQVDRALPGVPFGFVSIKPCPARAHLLDSIRVVNTAARQSLSAHPGGFYVDVFEAMLDPDERPRPELFLDDGLHLSRSGYELWARVLGTHRGTIFTQRSDGVHIPDLRSDRDGPGVP